MIESWVETAARTQIDDHRHRQYAEPLSAAARNRFRAALRNFAHTAQETGLVSLSGLADLSELFHDAVVEATLGRWGQMIGEPGGLSRRSASDYVRDLCLLLDRNGLAGPAENLRGRRNYHPDLRRGKEEGKMMSPKTQSWCRKLLSDPRRSSLFETQHIEYWRIAREALEAAREAKLDLRMLANPDRMAELPLKSRSLANHLLRRARMFGTLAAFSAIELEGAPFRKSNVLDFTMRGKRTRFFDHSTATSPHFEIIVPNDELKNGHFLTRRQQEIPPIQIEDVVETDHGFRILRWFLDEIRPLFPNAENSDYLFLALKKGKPRLATGTFDDWLRVCSSEIGIPLTAHNFRHGYVSIQYNEDPSCLEDLAAVLGDTASTLRRHYAFIDRVRQRRAVQESIRERRMKRNAACRPIPAARSK
jgi:hypothetical protein